MLGYNMYIIDSDTNKVMEVRYFNNKKDAVIEKNRLSHEGYNVKIYPENKIPISISEKRILGKRNL